MFFARLLGEVSAPRWSDWRSVWVAHPGGTRNWLGGPNPERCYAKASTITAGALNKIPKRHSGAGAYSLNPAQSAVAYSADLGCGPAIPPPPPSQLLKLVVLNGDFDANGTAWFDLDGAGHLPFAWNDPWVDDPQLEWLALELAAAKVAGQKVIVFVHHRLDGGPGE